MGKIQQTDVVKGYTSRKHVYVDMVGVVAELSSPGALTHGSITSSSYTCVACHGNINTRMISEYISKIQDTGTTTVEHNSQHNTLRILH